MTAARSVDRRGRRRAAIAAAAVAAAVVALVVVLLVHPWRAPAAATVSADRTAAIAGRGGAGAGLAGRAGAAALLPSDLAELVAYLRGRYGKHIASAYVQMQMIEKLMRHFQEKNPAGWQAELLAAVRAAFPERYEEIAAILQHRLDYEEWLKGNRARLQALGERERRDALWEERKRRFGEQAADEIWSSERKNRAISDALVEIDARQGATVGDRLAQYKESILETHQENTDGFMQSHRNEAMSRFLGLESVQRELAALPPDRRAATLREVRKGLGLDEAALGRWDALDRERDGRWEAGLRYMAERAELAKQYAGDALEAHLQELRARHFGAEAGSIADEEASGFFRFSQPRKHGLN